MEACVFPAHVIGTIYLVLLMEHTNGNALLNLLKLLDCMLWTELTVD